MSAAAAASARCTQSIWTREMAGDRGGGKGGEGVAWLKALAEINRLAGLKTNIDADTQLDVTGII